MFKKNEIKEKYKVSEIALNLLVTEAMPKLKLSIPLSKDDVLAIADYFYGEEVNLANAKENYNEIIDEDCLDLVCKIADEFNTEPFDLEDLNSRIMKKMVNHGKSK